MDLKIVCAIVCFFALTITSIEAGIPKCCVKTRKEIPQSVLLNVESWDVQSGTFECSIDAVKLYFKDQKTPMCAPPETENTLRRLRENLKRRTHRRKYPHHQSWRKNRHINVKPILDRRYRRRARRRPRY